MKNRDQLVISLIDGSNQDSQLTITNNTIYNAINYNVVKFCHVFKMPTTFKIKQNNSDVDFLSSGSEKLTRIRG